MFLIQFSIIFQLKLEGGQIFKRSIQKIFLSFCNLLYSNLPAFSAAWFIGPRLNRYDNGTDPIPPKNPMAICIALFILWSGWIGFNAGSSYGVTNGKWEFAARAGAGTTLASMSAGTTGVFLSLAKHKGKIDIFEVVSSVISGLGEFEFG